MVAPFDVTIGLFNLSFSQLIESASVFGLLIQNALRADKFSDDTLFHAPVAQSLQGAK